MIVILHVMVLADLAAFEDEIITRRDMLDLEMVANAKENSYRFEGRKDLIMHMM